MLFNSYAFLLVFLPASLWLYRLALARGGSRAALSLMLALSALFYSSWGGYVYLLATSVIGNFAIGWMLQRLHHRAARRAVFALGVVANLGALAWFKYANFVAQQFGLPPVRDDALPLGISFFTFQQIAFLHFLLVHEDERPAPLEYSAAVTFFPHLVSGPLLRYESVMSQMRAKLFGMDRLLVLQGLVLLVIGLAKKALIADPLAPHVAAVFAKAQADGAVASVDALMATVAYSAQLYFDFSGYSDMAIGLGMLFGVRMPWNFNSPYKASDPSDFWRRWHISLSQFLRDFLYVPLGGNRHGRRRQMFALAATMVIGGAWHGAGWTFVVWGAWHGAWLVVWHMVRHRLTRVPAWVVRAATLLLVVAGWIWFRAPDLPTALVVFDAFVDGWDLRPVVFSGWMWPLAAGTAMGLALVAPNSQEIAVALTAEDRLKKRWLWRGFGIAAAVVLWRVGGVTEFLYANF